MALVQTVILYQVVCFLKKLRVKGMFCTKGIHLIGNKQPKLPHATPVNFEPLGWHVPTRRKTNHSFFQCRSCRV